MEPSTYKDLFGSLRLFIVSLHHIIAPHHDLPHGLSIMGYLFHILIDDLRLKTDVGHTLACLDFGPFLDWKLIPFRPPFADGVRAISFGETIKMNQLTTQLFHSHDNCGRWRSPSYSHTHLVRKP